MDDFKNRSPPLEAMIMNSLASQKLALIGGFSQLDLQIGPNFVFILLQESP